MVSTETRSTAVASISASTVSRSCPNVRSACRGHSSLDTVTGLIELTVTFDCCRGKFYDAAATTLSNNQKSDITRRRSYSFAEYWKHFISRLNGVHAFGYNSAGSEPIWIKFGALLVHCLPLALTDFGRDRRRSESERASRIFVFFVQ